LIPGRKMLLADDSITIQKVIDLTFADEGMQVTTVSNGEQAIQRLEEIAPDIVLADIFMPGRTGYEVCEHIKQSERFSHIPVMLLVGSFEPFDETEARRVGADDFLTKPFQSIRQLVNKVAALLGAADDERTTRDLTMPAAAAAAAQTEKRGVEPTELSMADTAPLPAGMMGDSERATDAGKDRADHASFDDEMIEAAPGNSFGRPGGSDFDSRLAATAPLAASEFEELRLNPADDIASRQMQETIGYFEPPPVMPEAKSESAPAARQAVPASQMAHAAAADDALLDLGEFDPPPATAEADDFILDLQYEAPAPRRMQPEAAPLTEDAPPPFAETDILAGDEEEMVEAAPQATEFGEAQSATAQAESAELAQAQEPQMAEPEAPLQETMAAVALGLAEPPRAEMTAVAAGSEDHASTLSASSAPDAAASISMEQLPPELIDAIARRVVEQMSERVVQEIAWEVVPQLAELLIKRRLEEERKQ
jgi:CheY-like chemotaxis protein